jgi:hypothetical protein
MIDLFLVQAAFREPLDLITPNHILFRLARDQ